MKKTSPTTDRQRRKERKVQVEMDETERLARIKKNGGFFQWTETDRAYRGVWIEWK